MVAGRRSMGIMKWPVRVNWGDKGRARCGPSFPSKAASDDGLADHGWWPQSLFSCNPLAASVACSIGREEKDDTSSLRGFLPATMRTFAFLVVPQACGFGMKANEKPGCRTQISFGRQLKEAADSFKLKNDNCHADSLGRRILMGNQFLVVTLTGHEWQASGIRYPLIIV